MAEKLHLDGADRADIKTVGTPPEEARVTGFRLPHISDVQFGLPSFLKNRLRHYLTSRPIAIPEKCHLCGVCVDTCPPQAIAIKDGRLTFDYHRCIRCFCCRELCPDGALDIREGTLLKYLKKFQ
jgi:ferredoxin